MLQAKGSAATGPAQGALAAAGAAASPDDTTPTPPPTQSEVINRMTTVCQYGRQQLSSTAAWGVGSTPMQNAAAVAIAARGGLVLQVHWHMCRTQHKSCHADGTYRLAVRRCRLLRLWLVPPLHHESPAAHVTGCKPCCGAAAACCPWSSATIGSWRFLFQLLWGLRSQRQHLMPVKCKNAHVTNMWLIDKLLHAHGSV